MVSFQSSTPTMPLSTNDGMARPPGEPIAATKRRSLSSTIVGVIEDRGRLPGATALAAGVPSLLSGENEKSVSWLLRKNPSTIRPSPNTLSTVVVIATTSPQRSTTTKEDVPPGSLDASTPGCGAP